jgi:hypothetical protein
MGAEVVIASSGMQRALLVQQFPALTHIHIPGYEIRYPSSGSMAVSMFLQGPSLLSSIRNEHLLLNDIIHNHNITHVISDNRYGLWSSKVKSVFMTHQVHIQAPPVIKEILFLLNRSFIQKFHSLWIPDFEGPGNLAGTLSYAKKIGIPNSYIGPLSRFSEPDSAPVKKYDVIVLLSGPEPQRTILENILVTGFPESHKKILVVRGLPGETIIPEPTTGIQYHNHIKDDDLKKVLHPETLLLCRPGYSTLMDLYALNHSKAFFIPTPGQTEQEYLAEYWKQQFGFDFADQVHFSWDTALQSRAGSLPTRPQTAMEHRTHVIRKFLFG